MKQISVGLFTLSAVLSPAVQAYNSGSISFAIDNDGIVGTDQNYTNGIFFDWHSSATPIPEIVAPAPIRHIAVWLPLDTGMPKGWSYRLGQQMWTPEDIESLVPIEGERPYAGLLFFEAGIYQYSPAQVDKYSAMIGTVGPNSLAEQGQTFIHKITGSDDPNGWDFQIENQVVFNLGYQGHRLLTRNNAIGAEIGFDKYDLSSVSRINLGNYQSEIALGTVARWGNSLSSNFGTTGFGPGRYVDISVLSTSPTGYFLFAGIEGRYRFNDITIDGDRPEEVPDAHVKNLQATAVIGTVYYQPKWGISLSLASNTREFEEDMHTYSTIGSLELFWRL